MMNDILYNQKCKKDQAKKTITKVCKCGWKNTIANRYRKMICVNCGNMVYLDDKEEFMVKIRRELKKGMNQ